MADVKAIFSEGIELVMTRDGSYTVTDKATGLPIAGVRGFRVEPWEELAFSNGDIVPVGQRVDLDIESGNMTCYLTMETKRGDGDEST